MNRITAWVKVHPARIILVCAVLAIVGAATYGWANFADAKLQESLHETAPALFQSPQAADQLDALDQAKFKSVDPAPPISTPQSTYQRLVHYFYVKMYGQDYP